MERLTGKQTQREKEKKEERYCTVVSAEKERAKQVQER